MNRFILACGLATALLVGVNGVSNSAVPTAAQRAAATDIARAQSGLGRVVVDRVVAPTK